MKIKYFFLLHFYKWKNTRKNNINVRKHVRNLIQILVQTQYFSICLYMTTRHNPNNFQRWNVWVVSYKHMEKYWDGIGLCETFYCILEVFNIIESLIDIYIYFSEIWWCRKMCPETIDKNKLTFLNLIFSRIEFKKSREKFSGNIKNIVCFFFKLVLYFLFWIYFF